ncbi:MAG: hypothetical protein R3F17_05895 [Planctomycetota bacterium]
MRPDGLRMASLLIVRLRFERLLRGSRLAGRWYDSDPATFANAFRTYHATVPPRDLMPAQEAEAFEAWCLDSDRTQPGPT